MGFFKNLLSKEEAPEQTAQNARTPQKELAAQIAERLRVHTSRPVLVFSLVKNSAGLFDSKIGGAFYVPEDRDCPKNSAGRDMYLLAQLNFSELPHLEDFPERGLLQIFLSGDGEIYGINFDDPAGQKDWCIRYLTDVPLEREIDESRIFHPEWQEDTCLPIGYENCYRLKAEIGSQTVTLCDYRITDLLRQTCADLLPEDFQNVYDLDDDVYSELLELLDTYACQMGGYPNFTQYDPREDTEDAPDILLFQLDTIEDIMWGDSGVGNFFIRREDLQNSDFSRVWYNWDCC
jgi:uncharacterized protein YwqG